MATAATPTPTPAPSGFNIWQVLTGLTTALLVAAVLGMFSMYRSQADNAKDIVDLKEQVKRIPILERDLIDYKLSTNSKLSTVDNIKEGVDRLNRLQDLRNLPK
jgi:hypothetical protein